MQTDQIQQILKEGTILKQSNADIINIISHLSNNSYVPSVHLSKSKYAASDLKDYRVSITDGEGKPLLGYTIKATNRDEALKIAEVTYEDRMKELSVERPEGELLIEIF